MSEGEVERSGGEAADEEQWGGVGPNCRVKTMDVGGALARAIPSPERVIRQELHFV